jgi:fused signal recognition particle receptor
MTNDADKPAAGGLFKTPAQQDSRGSRLAHVDLADLLPGRKIDAEILDELETRLISADVGMEATSRILEDLRKRVARKELADVDALLKALHEAMLAILRPVERRS